MIREVNLCDIPKLIVSWLTSEKMLVYSTLATCGVHTFGEGSNKVVKESVSVDDTKNPQVLLAEKMFFDVSLDVVGVLILESSSTYSRDGVSLSFPLVGTELDFDLHTSALLTIFDLLLLMIVAAE